MIEALYLFTGIALTLLIFVDILFTTYSMEGGGKLTDFFLGKSWGFLLWANGYKGKSKLLNYSGMIMMISLIFLWGLGIWLGVFLIFSFSPDSVLHSNTNQPTDMLEKIYFSGYLLSTMGLGEYVPSNSKWGILSSFFSFYGLIFITLIVSYALPVLSKIIDKKQFSLYIHHWGATPQELLLYFWNGKDFSNLKEVSKELQQKILLIGQSHQAYPILHYFHAHRREESLVITLCVIDEALTLLLNRVAPEQWEEKEVLPLQKALTAYLGCMKKTYKYKENYNFPIYSPDLQMLLDAKVKLVEDRKNESQRKALWSELLKSKGWAWNEVYLVSQDRD